jgi:hypothetical protein
MKNKNELLKMAYPPRRSGRNSLCQDAWLVLIENTKRPNNLLCHRFAKRLSLVS